MDGYIGFNENILGDIGGIGGIMDNVVDDGKEALSVGFDKLIESRLGTIFNSDDEGIVTVRWGSLGTFRFL
jgi:hypothetical protein